MFATRCFVSLALIGLLASGSVVRAGSAESAAQSFDEGNALLAKADFDGAAKAYAAAAKADPQNASYRDQYKTLKQIMKLREGLNKETNPEKWQSTAASLRSFYCDNKLFSETLALDLKNHEKLKTAESATLLAATQLELGQNAEAAAVLAGVEAGALPLDGQVLQGIAFARQAKLDAAKAVADKCTLPDDAGAEACFNAARLQALIGRSKDALAALTRSFELTPPSRLEAAKAVAKASPDFAALAAGPEFAQALETSSKVKESSCSSGKSCGSCPSKGGCSSKDHAKSSVPEKK